MSSLIFKIKNQYNLKMVFDYMQLNTCYELAYGSRKLLELLEITAEKYKILNRLKRLINSSYDIYKYLDYIDRLHSKEKYNNKKIEISESKYIYKRLLFGLLNNSSFNNNLCMEYENSIDIISHIFKWNLIISPSFLKYMSSLEDKQLRIKLFILNLHKNYIKAISFKGFKNEDFINKTTIDKIIFLLKKIFIIEEENNNNNKNDILVNNNNEKNKYFVNDSHNIKNISFDFSKTVYLNDLFIELTYVISFSSIESFFINGNSYNQYQFNNTIYFIANKMNSLKYLKINKFLSGINNITHFSKLFLNINEQIERLEINDTVSALDLFSILKLKNYPLKELKIHIFSQEKEIDWDFLEKYIDTMETLQIKLIVINIHKNIDKIMNIINKMKNIKNLNIIGGFDISQLINFHNFEKITDLNIDINITKENYEYSNDLILNYFSNFKNLKNLGVEKRASINSFNKFYIFNFPSALTCINLINIDAISLIILLITNKEYLSNIKELKIENVIFKDNEFENLLCIFKDFKSLIKLYINKIKLPRKYFEDDSIINYIHLILENIPSLIELDITNNDLSFDEYINKKNEIYIPITFLSLKILSSNIPIYFSKLNDLQYVFEGKLDIIEDK